MQKGINVMVQETQDAMRVVNHLMHMYNIVMSEIERRGLEQKGVRFNREPSFPQKWHFTLSTFLLPYKTFEAASASAATVNTNFVLSPALTAVL